MNILIIDQYAGSPRMGMELRPFELAYEWNRLGCKTMIAAGSFSHLRRENPEGISHPVRRSEKGVGYLFISTRPYRGNGKDRALNIFDFVCGLSASAVKLAHEFIPDVVIASSTHPFDVVPALKIAKKAGAKTVFEIHDIWPMSLCELYGYSKSHPLMLLIDSACRYAFSKCNIVVSLLSDGERYLKERGLKYNRCAFVPNGASCSGTSLPDAEVAAALSKHRDKYGSLVIYAGGYNKANCPDDLAAICALLPDVGFAAIGGEGEFPYKAPDNLMLTPKVDHSQIKPLLSMADVLWIGTKDKQMYRYGVSMNKLYDYISSKRPTVFSCVNKNNPVELSNGGITTPPEDNIKSAEAIRGMLKLSDDERNAIGENAARYAVESCSYRDIAKRYLKVLEEL